MKTVLVVAIVALVVAGCGGGSSRSSGKYHVTRMASGPISNACLASDRKARSPELCGCIQAAANDTLSSSDQRLAVSFYKDPHKAQEIRQSKSRSHEAFWERYSGFVERAKSICTGV